jgi:hypothetical protein
MRNISINTLHKGDDDNDDDDDNNKYNRCKIIYLRIVAFSSIKL